MPAHMRVPWLEEPLCALNSLTRVCARDAQAKAAVINTAATAVAAGIVSAVTTAAAPLPVATPVPLKRVLPAASVRLSQAHGSDPRWQFARMLGVLSLAVIIDDRWWLSDRWGAHFARWSTLTCRHWCPKLQRWS